MDIWGRLYVKTVFYVVNCVCVNICRSFFCSQECFYFLISEDVGELEMSVTEALCFVVFPFPDIFFRLDEHSVSVTDDNSAAVPKYFCVRAKIVFC